MEREEYDDNNLEHTSLKYKESMYDAQIKEVDNYLKHILKRNYESYLEDYSHYKDVPEVRLVERDEFDKLKDEFLDLMKIEKPSEIIIQRREKILKMLFLDYL